MKDRRFYVCMPVEKDVKQLIIPGSIQEKCSRCGRKVWMSPATYMDYKELGGEILCIKCAIEVLEDEENGFREDLSYIA